jgi:hypothetical protein
VKKTPHTITTCTINNLRAIDNQEEEVVGSCCSHLAALKKAKALNKDATKALNNKGLYHFSYLASLLVLEMINTLALTTICSLGSHYEMSLLFCS